MKEEEKAGGALGKCLFTQQTAPFGNTKPLGDSADPTAAASRNSVPFTIGESTPGVLAGGAAAVPKPGWRGEFGLLGALLASLSRGAHPARPKHLNKGEGPI